MAKTRDELQALWRQGAILTPDAHPNLLDKAHIEINPNDHLLVLNQTCDLIQTDHSKEPFIELLPLHTIDNIDNGLIGGKVSRALHLDLTDPIVQLGPLCCCFPFERFFANHELIEDMTPIGFLDEFNLSCVADWLYMRYNRIALPTSYVDRLGSIKHRLERKFKQFVDVREVRIKVEPMTELDSEDIYTVEMLIVMSDEDFGNQAIYKKNDEILNAIQEIFDSVDTLEIGDLFHVMCMSEITYDVIDEFAKLDLAYLSYREGEEALFPVGPG